MKRILLVTILLVIILSSHVSAISSNTLTLKLGWNTVEDSVRGVVAKKFKEVVEEKTNGNIIIENYCCELLGNAMEQIDAIKIGAQGLNLAGNQELSPIVEEISLFNLPFLFEDAEEGLAFSKSEIAQAWHDKLYERGIKLIRWYDLGFAQITNKVRPVHTADDMKGLKMRAVSGATLAIDSMKALGAAVTTMPYSELYMGLQTGVIDGQFNPVDAIYESKFYEVQEHLAMVNLFWYTFSLAMNRGIWESLDAENQAIFIEAADMANEAAIEYTNSLRDEYLSLLEDELEITYVTGDALEGFREKLKPVYDNMNSQYPDVNKMLEWLENYRKNK
ncbi:MAG: TRAP transporter substrate-binding protein [Candidatus Atribacteria bacterium]|nr:TRAP transporter substrate-binding protein [Candidatus Atribacteria bacterium]